MCAGTSLDVHRARHTSGTMQHGVLIGGTGPWSDTLDELLRKRGIVALRAANLPEVRVCLRHIRPAFVVLGPALCYADIIRGFLEARESTPSSSLVVALDHDDREFASDLLAIGVPALVLVPIGLANLAEEAKRTVEAVASHAA
jgi:hypothetical protein